MVKDSLLQDFKYIALAAQKAISKAGNSLGPKFNAVKIYLNPEQFGISELKQRIEPRSPSRRTVMRSLNVDTCEGRVTK